jgi:hypothetical protein
MIFNALNSKINKIIFSMKKNQWWIQAKIYWLKSLYDKIYSQIY